MSSYSERKYKRVVSYIEDQIGADVNRDLLKVALSEQDIAPLVVSTSPDDEIRARLFGQDGNGDIEDVQVVQLSSSIASTTTAQVTYLARALESNGLDEFISRVTDSNGNQIDPLTQAVTQSVGDDAVRVVSPDPLDVSAAEVDVDIATQSKSPLTITDDGNLAIAAWNAGTLTVTDDGSLNVAGTVSVEESSPLDVSATTVPVEIDKTSNDKSTTQLANSEDISAGVSHQIGRKEYSVFVSNTGSSQSDVTLSYSPDGGATYIGDPDGSVTISSGAGTIFAIDYDTTHVQVSASNTEPFDVWVVEQ